MSHTEPARRRNWPWVVLVVVAVVAVIVGASVVSSMLAWPTPQAAAPAPTEAATEPAATPTVTPTVTPTRTASASDSLSEKDIAAIESAVDDNDPTGLYEYLTDPVHVQFAASDFDSDRSPDNAVVDLAYIKGSSGWNWDVDPSTVLTFRAGAYGDQFDKDAIVGESAEGYVISFTVVKDKISQIFVSKSVGLVTAPAAG